MAERVDAGGAGVFSGYAGFYDALYQDKDYDAECDFLETVFEKFANGRVKRVLDLGCGTGGHDIPLAKRGYDVVGVDRAPAMVEQAREKAAREGVTAEFVVGDVRDVDVGHTFDAVVSMFAVVSYQTENQDLSDMMKTARRHLEQGGLFVFDGWFGPGVLAERPDKRTKTVDLPNGEAITRSATPSLDLLAHTVDVGYRVTRSKGAEVLEQSEESHTVRFLFPQEVAHFLELAGLRLERLTKFADLGSPPTDEDWTFSVVARAV